MRKERLRSPQLNIIIKASRLACLFFALYQTKGEKNYE